MGHRLLVHFRSVLVMQPALPAMKRTLLQFVGETHHDIPNYSHGVRQAVMQLNNTPGKAQCSWYIEPGLPANLIALRHGLSGNTD